MVFTKKIIGLLCAFAFLLASCSKPVASFSIGKKSVKTAPAKITFENKSKKAESYEWDFGDGIVSAAQKHLRINTSNLENIPLLSKLSKKEKLVQKLKKLKLKLQKNA